MSSGAITANDSTLNDPRKRTPLINGHDDYASITETVCRVAEREKTPKAWYIAFAVSCSATGILFLSIGYLFITGVGVWGNNSPVFWGWPIVNFVFWVGIGHAGTLISAILFLFRQQWRTSINRFCRGHDDFCRLFVRAFSRASTSGESGASTGWLPTRIRWKCGPIFAAPCFGTCFAVSTYATVSALFWYFGMIPDLATLRDRATNKWRKLAYSVTALGWRGSARQWHRYERAYLFLAALATPLVLSVHSVVSFDFAVAQVPGWHTTIFPPYFVAGAIFSGFAMVVTLMVPARAWFGLKDLVTVRHLENMNKIILATSCIVGYAYATEFFIAWYSGSQYELFAFLNRALGPYKWAYWTMVCCNVVVPHLFWFKKCRTTPWIMMIVAILVNVGMWFERFVIIVTSLSRDFLPSSWGEFVPTPIDIVMLLGSFRIVLHALPAVLPLPANGRHGRGEGRGFARY